MSTRTPALGRLIASGGAGAGAQPAAVCGMCGGAVSADHRHLFAVASGKLHCACRPCGLLFESGAAAEGRYLLVPQRRVPLQTAGDDPAGRIGVPVGLVFLVPQPGGPAVANYPSPLGVTQSVLGDAGWQGLLARWPVLRTMAPHVEAVLLNSVRGAREHWLVPVDDCYRLAALVRQRWKGMSGGREVWPAVSEFFAELAAGVPRR